MTQKWTGALVAMVMASAIGCKKDLHTSPVSAVLGGDAAGKLSKAELAFLEVLPADVKSFGYVELGFTADQLIPVGNEYRGISEDLFEMAQRRWGVEIRNLHGFGIASLGEDQLFFAEIGKADALPTNDGKLATAKLGSMTVMGRADAVKALMASAQKGPALIKAKPEWMRHALNRGAGQIAFYTFSGEMMRAEADADEKAVTDAIDDATMTAGATGGAMWLSVKPGQMATVKGPIEIGLGKVREKATAAIAQMNGDGADAVLGVLARHFGQSLLDGIKLEEQGDTLAVSLAWRAPQLPPSTPAPALSQRVVVADEWAVAQLDLGSPVLQSMIALANVVGKPVNSTLLEGELMGALAQLLDVPAVDPRGATLSVGGMSGVLSLPTVRGQMPKGQFAIAKGELVASATPWGLAVTLPSMDSTLAESLAKPAAGLPLAAQSKLLTNDKAILRAAVDFDRLPMMAKAMAGSVPVRTAEVSFTAEQFDAVVVAKPGQAGQIQGLANMAKSMIASHTEQPYQNRKSASPEDEVQAVVHYHAGKVFAQALTPKVEGDKLTFSYKNTMAQIQPAYLGAAIGIVAGVAVPAFMDYMKRGSHHD